MRVLIVEDEKELAGLLTKYLKNVSSDVVVVGTASEAETRVDSEKFDLILSDHLTGGKISGLDLWLKVKDMTPKIPFILISGHGDAVFSDLLDQGIDCPPYLNKPFRRPEVEEAIKKALGTSDTE